jgi:hypothetical protein
MYWVNRQICLSPWFFFFGRPKKKNQLYHAGLK